MYHIAFNNTSFNLAILIKHAALQATPMIKEYIEPMKAAGIDTSGVIGFSLDYDKKKPSATCRKAYLDKLLPELDRLGINTILCCDGEYFKSLVGGTKSEAHLGDILPCKVKGYEHINVAYGFNYQTFFYNPDNRARMGLSFKAIQTLLNGTYAKLGTNVLRTTYTPTTEAEIASWLEKLLTYPKLSVDIEAFSLKHYEAGIGTISFSWDEHSAVKFAVDAVACEPYEIDIWDKKDKRFKKRIAYIKQVDNRPIKLLLKKFFEPYTGQHIWHNASYDVTVLIYELWMDSIIDRKGLLTGLDVMTKHMECSQVVTYLATNSCAGNQLGLKAQAHEFVGNYALDVTDIRLQPLDDLLEYNAIDTCATLYVWDKNYARMVQDDQEQLYLNDFKPYLIDIIDMQLTGMTLDMQAVLEAETELTKIKDNAVATVANHPMVQAFVEDCILREVAQRNAAYKSKVIGIDEAKFKLNLNSGQQMQQLLYGYFKLPVIDQTDKKQPATGSNTLKKLINHTKDEGVISVLKALREYAGVEKILTSFIPNFKTAPLAPDGYHYLFGSFKLGGTVSGRLSSSNPNMQNIPSGSTFAKWIKACFIAPKGYLFGGADSASLEDRIDALLTKDTNKLRVYTDGFDGHSLRAAYYFPDKMPDIDPNSVESVNSIKDKYPEWRQASKAPTFALTYQGMWITLMKNCGFTEKEAKSIEANYHKLYAESDAWKAAKIKKCTEQGYATVAFGLKVRTPLLRQVILGNNKTPFEAEAEGRTVGNAFGQSYGLLNNRAGREVMAVVRASKYRYDICMCAMIHDALYFRWPDNIKITRWLNDVIAKAMAWQDLPEIAHPEVHLSGELDIFYPNWANPITLSNYISESEIVQVIIKEANKRKEIKLDEAC